MYYDYLRRYGTLILVGLLIGATLGFVYFQTQPKRTVFVARAAISMPPSVEFTMVSPPLPNAQAAADYIVGTAHQLEQTSQAKFTPKKFEIKGRHRNELWKSMALGSVVGGLGAIGIVYVWDDAKTYQRRRREGESEIP